MSDKVKARIIAEVYGSVVKAGIHRAPSIRVAEAAKVIENTQRDLNIAFMNELSLIFQALDIDTGDVLAAARTKWNFLPFQPGLVGGHCIGVDPYYLTYRAEKAGYHPEVILAGRRINDGMGQRVARECVRGLLRRKDGGGVVTILGLQLGILLAGAIITEKIFGWPGLGLLLVEDGIGKRDYRVVQGCVLVISLTYIIANMLTDAMYRWLDPRIRVG